MADEHLRLKKVLEFKLKSLPEGEFLEVLAEAAFSGMVDTIPRYDEKRYIDLEESHKEAFRSIALRVIRRYREGDGNPDG